jgi:hypothetical protein
MRREIGRCGAPLPEVDRVPDVMIRRLIAVPRRPREQTRVDVELEQRIVVRWQSHANRRTLGNELSRERGAATVVGNEFCTTSHVERILIRGGWKRMERVRTASFQAELFRRRNDEREQAVVRDQRAHRVNPRAPISSDGCEKPKPYSVLIQQRPTLRGESGLLLDEDTPGDRARTMPHPAPLCEHIAAAMFAWGRSRPAERDRSHQRPPTATRLIIYVALR